MRELLADDKSLIELLLAVDSGTYSVDELEDACAAAMTDGCVTRAVIEQRALAQRGRDRDEILRLAEEECGVLGQHRFAIESPEMYDELMQTKAEKEVG